MNESDQDQLFPDPIGQRLKTAREAKGMSLDDVARQTRVPIRHLQHIEKGEWDALPATTYSVGFARAYANAVGLNGSEIGIELREQLGTGPSYQAATPAYYEPADPARVPPRSLALIAAGLAVLLVLGYAAWRSGAVDSSGVEESKVAATETQAEAPPPAPQAATPQAAPAPTPAATGPVVLTATDEIWLRVYEGGGGPKLFEGMLKPGDRYEVPATAKQPQILTGRADAVRVTVGATEIPPLGTADRTIADVSLAPSDLLARAGNTAPGAAPPPAVPAR